MEHEKNVPFGRVVLKDGFWLDRYNLNKNVSLKSVYERFEETGRMDALRFNHEKTGKPLHIYFDSDVYKWIEAVAYLYFSDPGSQKENVAIADELIASLKNNQRADGYLNSYHQQIAPQDVFKLRSDHELYTFGHLIEAAVAYAECVGKTELLGVAEKACDCVYRAFISDKTAAFVTPGHEEIELALMKLYDYTKDEKYFDMAKFFLTERGKNEKERSLFEKKNAANVSEAQDNADIYHLHEAVGHAVRALYFYCGIADYAEKTRDEDLLKNLDDVFDDIKNRKSYVTGGVGSTFRYEGFTKPYDLPNETAYSESCAAIALVFFCVRMRKMNKNAKYGALAEHVLYNAALSSVGMDGKSFFYVNPLEIDVYRHGRETAASEDNREWLPITERKECFYCSCCPPNINRFFAEIGSFIAFDGDNDVTIEQYIPAVVNTGFGKVEISGNYASTGRVTLSSSGFSAKSITLRIPEWCNDLLVKIDGKKNEFEKKDGYASFCVKEKFVIDVDFSISPKFVATNPRVSTNSGRVALTFGPLVYCVEGVDNGPRLNNLSVDVDSVKAEGEYGGFGTFVADGFREEETDELYVFAEKKKTKPVKLHFVPYYTFANRGESDMLVWVRRA